jgi:hypothetical protein
MEKTTLAKRMTRLCVIAALGVVSATPHAHAAGTFSSDRGVVNGIELKYGSTVLLTDQTFLSSDSLCGAIYSPAARDTLNKLVFGRAGMVSNSLPEGVRFVRQRFDLSPGCSARVGYTGNELTVTISLPRNIFFTNITTPTVFGQYADPSVSVDFDVVATAKVNIPSNPQEGLTLGPFTFKVSKIDPQGQNLTADVGIGIARLVDDLGGFGFAQQLQTGFTFPFDPIKINLKKFADKAGERGKNARLANDYDTARKLVVLNLEQTGFAVGQVVPGEAFDGGWQTVTNSNGHFTMVFTRLPPTDPRFPTLDPLIRFVGTFVNTDGAGQYNGQLTGAVQRGSRVMAYTYSQPGISAAGTGTFTLSPDGRSFAGDGLAMGKDRFTWNGTRIQTKTVCPKGLRGPNCDEIIVN